MSSRRVNGIEHEDHDAVGARAAGNALRVRCAQGVLAVTLMMLALSSLAFGETTGWLNPSAEAGDFGKAANAFYDDTSVADLDNADTHQYWGYGIDLPTGSVIHGIEIRVDAERTTQEATEILLELSWDGGMSWTSTGHTTGALTATMGTYVAGGPADGWGRSWSPSDLADASFRVRATVSSAGTGKVAKLDWIAVAVSYDAQLLELSTQSLDFGPLTLVDFEAGFQEKAPAQTLTISSGSSWVLTIQAASVAWTYTGAHGDPLKPCGDLAWRSASANPLTTYVNTSYANLTTGPVLVASGNAGSSIEVTVDARMLVGFASDPPGDYAIEITYVLTTP